MSFVVMTKTDTDRFIQQTILSNIDTGHLISGYLSDHQVHFIQWKLIIINNNNNKKLSTYKQIKIMIINGWKKKIHFSPLTKKKIHYQFHKFSIQKVKIFSNDQRNFWQKKKKFFIWIIIINMDGHEGIQCFFFSQIFSLFIYDYGL